VLWVVSHSGSFDNRPARTDVFPELAARFQQRYDAVRELTDRRYLRADWAERNAELERDLMPVPAADFLRHPAIRYQMFVDEHVLPHELPFVRSQLPDDRLLYEDPVGRPPTVALPPNGIQTSSNTVHQLYHLLRYKQETGRRLQSARTIVEWGGGFGSLMRLIFRMHGGSPTCIVIDTPIFSAVQWLYLSAVLGEEHVVLHDSGPVGLVEGRINLVPIGLVSGLSVTADLFISNWALNESTQAAQDDVVSRQWFGADSLLLAMHGHHPLTGIAREWGARTVPLGSFMPGQQYLVS
jgi:hypothetical protein